jgi:hypothetical protein
MFIVKTIAQKLNLIRLNQAYKAKKDLYAGQQSNLNK